MRATHTSENPTTRAGGHRLVEDDDAAQELQGGREVLEQAEQRERDAAGRRREEEQGHGGHHPQAHEERVAAEGAVEERSVALGLQHGHADQRRREQHRRLDSERRRRLDAHRLLQEAVPGERTGQDQRDPRHPAVGGGEHGDSGGAEPERHELYASEVLPEHPDAERHRDQRVDVVPERRLDDVVVVDGPDVDEPVRGDEHRRGRQVAQPVRGLADRRVPPSVPAHRAAGSRPRRTTRPRGAGGSRWPTRCGAGGTPAGRAPRASTRRCPRPCRDPARTAGRLAAVSVRYAQPSPPESSVRSSSSTSRYHMSAQSLQR